MSRTTKLSKRQHLKYNRLLSGAILAVTLATVSTPVFAQQVGGVNGYVTSPTGEPLSGVTVIATSPVLPSKRTTVSGDNGRYQLPALPPGQYVLVFEHDDGSTIERQAAILLQQKINLDVAFGGDEVVVTGTRIVIDSGAATLKNVIGSQTIDGVPVGQEYRDLQKLIPGVQYSEDTVRGPSAGGSGQDNGYQFDGVDVSLPLFGTLSAEPSTHDVDQVSIVRGGSKAIGFNRNAGFLINTTSKRGTNELHGEIGYTRQDSGLTADQETGSGAVKSQTDRDWITANLGGPIIKEKLFFYGSYYRPTVKRENSSNVYGDVGDFKSTRDEFFGKLTAAPTDNILLDFSYRTSDRSGENESVGGTEAASLSTASDASQDIIIAEGSWVIDDKSSLGFKFTDYTNETSSRPDTLFDLQIRQGDSLPISNLGAIGRLSVPTLRTGTLTPDETAFNTFVQPIVNQFSYDTATGGGAVGGETTINNQDFFRTNFEISYDRAFDTGALVHDMHFGYQYQKVKEVLARTSNGYGSITVPGGLATASDGITPVFYQALLSQTSILSPNGDTLAPPSINSRSVYKALKSTTRSNMTNGLSTLV